MAPSKMAPSLLISVPQMQDPNFARTVTLLVEADEEGAFGLVINRVSPIKLSEICASNDIACSHDAFVRVGGPVEQNRAWILHGPNYNSEHTFRVSDELLLTPTWEALTAMAGSEASEHFLVMLGYAGWGPGQLERELAEGTWLLTDVDAGLIFNDGDPDLWLSVLRKMGLDPGTIAQGGGGVN